jgi:hypothetical protein
LGGGEGGARLKVRLKVPNTLALVVDTHNQWTEMTNIFTHCGSYTKAVPNLSKHTDIKQSDSTNGKLLKIRK